MDWQSIKTSPELLRQLERARGWLAGLTPEQREEHFAQQRRKTVKAEMECDRRYGSEDATVCVLPMTHLPHCSRRALPVETCPVCASKRRAAQLHQ